MGLDVTAYSNLRYIGHHEASEGHPREGGADEPQHVKAFSYAEFSRHALVAGTLLDLRDERLVSGVVFVEAGCFERTPETEDFDFRAGSYGGYGTWRRDLAARYNAYRPHGDGSPNPEGPFYELLWFADNEGTLCSAAARNLLKDFRDFEDDYRLANSGTEHGEWHLQKYQDWKHACELAAADGLIEFY